MKKHKRIVARRQKFLANYKRAGGWCFNPLCAVGCIKSW